MRKVKETKIDGRKKPVTVRELTVEQILFLIDGGKAVPGKNMALGDLETFLAYCTDITLDDLKQLAPSEIKAVYDDFREVNAVFFEMARAVGFDKILQDLKTAVLKDFAKQYAAS
jgi:hypothetical protein